jgi:hypothetical protein
MSSNLPTTTTPHRTQHVTYKCRGVDPLQNYAGSKLHRPVFSEGVLCDLTQPIVLASIYLFVLGSVNDTSIGYI